MLVSPQPKGLFPFLGGLHESGFAERWRFRADSRNPAAANSRPRNQKNAEALKKFLDGVSSTLIDCISAVLARDRDMRKLVCILLTMPWLVGSIGMSYHARDPVWDLGFSETQLAPDLWRVMYRGYYIPEAQAGDYAMLRAAEVVKSAGYRYFIVENDRSGATPMGAGFLQGGTGSAFAASYSYPESGPLVRGTKRKPATGQVYDAEFVSDSIKAKYKIKN